MYEGLVRFMPVAMLWLCHFQAMKAVARSLLSSRRQLSSTGSREA